METIKAVWQCGSVLFCGGVGGVSQSPSLLGGVTEFASPRLVTS